MTHRHAMKFTIKKQTLYPLLSVIIPLITVIIIYFLSLQSFNFNHNNISENNGLQISFIIMTISGLLGIIFSILGIYYLILRTEIIKALSITILCCFPAMFFSVLILYGILIIKNII